METIFQCVQVAGVEGHTGAKWLLIFDYVDLYPLAMKEFHTTAPQARSGSLVMVIMMIVNNNGNRNNDKKGLISIT